MRLTHFVCGVLVALALAACGGAASPAPGSATIDATAEDFKFTPAEWTVPAGSAATVNLTNAGAQEHEWVLLKQGTSVTAPFDDDDEEKVFWEIEAEAGATGSGTFTVPEQAGEYTIVCGVPSHYEQGMVAKLIVK